MCINTRRVLTTEGGAIDAPEEAIEGRAEIAIEKSMKELMRILLIAVVVASPQQRRCEWMSRRNLFDGLDEGQRQVFLQCGILVFIEGGGPRMACDEL